MSRDEKHGKDAIAAGVDAKPGRKFQTGPKDDTPPAESKARPGTLAAALEQSEGRKVRVTRHGDEPADVTHPTDVHGKELTGKMLMAEALEQRARNREGR